MRMLAKWLAALALLLVCAPAFAQTSTPFGATAGAGLNFCAYKPDSTNLASCEVKYVWNGTSWVLEPADANGHPYVSAFQNFQSIGLSNISGPGASYSLSSATTAYTAGLLICSSATLATCNSSISAVWWVLPTGTIHLSGGSIHITDSTTTAWATNTQIQIDLWSSNPTMTNADRLAWAVTSGTSNWLASLLCTTAMGEQGDGVTFNCAVVGGPKDLNLGSANAKVYGTYLAYSGSGVTGASASLTATLNGTF